MGPFEIEKTHIQRLDQFQLTRLLKKMLYLEADVFDISRSSIHVPLDIFVPDGGEDGRIKWSDGPDRTDYIPSRYSVFQCKSTNLNPSDCYKEVLNADQSALKGQVKEVLDNKGCYVIFCREGYNQQQIEVRIEKFREAFKDAGRTDWDSAHVEFYDGNKIAGWVNSFIPSVAYVFECNGISFDLSIKTWEDWQSHEKFRVKYVSNEKLREYIQTIRELSAIKANPRLRITGLSGLGKTRLVLEAFRPTEGDDSFDVNVIAVKIAYVDGSLSDHDIITFVGQLRRLKRKGILVVDNCESTLHRQLVDELGYEGGNHIGLITLDYEPEMGGSTNWLSLQLKQVDCDGVVMGILEELFPGISSQTINQIERFAQNFASIAVLLGTQAQDGVQDIGFISDEQLVKRLLWGRESPDEKIISVVKACSLFEHFEFSDEEVSKHVEFLASKIAKVDNADFFKICKDCLNREIMQRRGHFVRLCPIPLAITIAAEWLEGVPGNTVYELIGELSNVGLYEQFCNQMSKLSFSKKAQDITEKLMGPEGPFGNPEALLTEEGSRLFRALVEVNPQATTQSLFNVISGKSRVDLLQIKGDVRRNLVWAIERLCWWEDTFPRASNMILALASSENETWSNNATGQFLQLFHVYLPGTEADLEARLQVIGDALKSQVSEERELAIRALGSALDTGGFSRGAGADTQGSRLPRRDYEPKGQEIRHYWKECIDLLKNQVTENNEFSELAASVLAMQIRGLLSNRMIDEIETAIETVVEARGPYWPDALVAVRHSLDYDAEEIPSDIRTRIEGLERMLLPESLEERLRLIVSVPDWRNIQEESGNYISVAADEAEKLAEELSRDTSWYDKVDVILKGEQRQSCAFGVKLGELAHNPKKFIDACLDSLERIPKEEASPEVIGYFLRGLSDNSLISETMERIVSHEKLVIYAVRITRCIEINEEHLRRLIPLIKEDKVPIADFGIFSFGRALDKLPTDFVMEFCEKIARHSVEGARCAFHVLYMYCYRNEPRFNLCTSQFRKLVMRRNLLHTESRNSIIAHNWEVVCNKLLSEDRKDEELAKYITKEIMIMSVSRDFYRLLPTRNARVVLSTVLKRYFDDCWPIVGEGLLDKKSGYHWSFRQLLGTGHEKEKSDALVTDLPEEKIIEWCKQNEPEGPISIASLIPIFSGEDPVSWHPFAKRIIDEFGHLNEVLDALSGNLFSFPSVGSRAPYYERRVRLLNALLDHGTAEVRQWAQNGIKYFTEERDDAQREAEEWQWGIH